MIIRKDDLEKVIEIFTQQSPIPIGFKIGWVIDRDVVSINLITSTAVDFEITGLDLSLIKSEQELVTFLSVNIKEALEKMIQSKVKELYSLQEWLK